MKALGSIRQLGSDLRAALSLAVPYWKSAERWRATALLAALIVLNLGIVVTTLLFTYWQGAFYNALEAKDWDRFLGSLFWWTSTPRDGFDLGFSPILAAFVIITALELYLRQSLQIRWRRWLSEEFTGDWLADRTYLRMALMDQHADNPDQRVAEDIRLFVDNALLLGLGLIRSLASIGSFLVILWTFTERLVLFGVTIHGYLVWVAFLCSAIGTWLAHLVGYRLTPLHYVQQKAEADFRFALVRLRENAEGIAFHRGEAEQKRELTERFTAIMENWWKIMASTLRLNFLTTGYAQLMLVFPLALVSPAYFAGRIPLGAIFQTSNAFSQVQTALSWIVTSYPAITEWLATVERLSDFRKLALATSATVRGPELDADGAEHYELKEVNITCPEGRSLLHDVNLRIQRGERILLTGPSGSGKSTLLRAIAGIWPFGSGSIQCGSGSQMFLPQRPYMPLGTLKRAVCYPMNEGEIPEAEAMEALRRVGLNHLACHLATTDAWDRRLSGGEQQRLAFCRILLSKPDWLFLDEATSSLDVAAEAQLYELLTTCLPDIGLVSVAHGKEAARYHSRFIQIEDGGILAEPGSRSRLTG